MIPRAGARPRLSLAGANIVVDGNSIYANTGGDTMASILSWLHAAPGATYTSVAISGQAWYGMIAHHGDVDGAYVAGKTNVLICAETTNAAVHGGGGPIRDGAGAWADCQAYVAARKASHPDWRIIVCGTPPIAGAGIPDLLGANAAYVQFDSLARVGHKTAGIDAFVDYRTESTPWMNHDGSVLSAFSSNAAMWSDAYVHPNNAGKVQMATQIILQGLSRLRA